MEIQTNASLTEVNNHGIFSGFDRMVIFDRNLKGILYTRGGDLILEIPFNSQAKSRALMSELLQSRGFRVRGSITPQQEIRVRPLKELNIGPRSRLQIVETNELNPESWSGDFYLIGNSVIIVLPFGDPTDAMDLMLSGSRENEDYQEEEEEDDWA